MQLFHQLGFFPKVAESANQVKNADMVILPGVGASGSAMAQLRQTGFGDELLNFNERQLPITGICVGAQLMFGKLYENNSDGLNLLPGKVVKIGNNEFNNGWCEIKLDSAKFPDNQSVEKKPLILKSFAKTFYFNHGYQIITSAIMQESASTCGDVKLLAYFVHNNLCGIQFHPEKSQIAGLSFIRNMMKHYGF